MSGIVGILNLDGASVDRFLLQRMTDFMTFRGPDAQQIWVHGAVGFGHTLLRSTEESERERQPFTLDGNVWIVADARVDAQSDLIAKLAARGEQVDRGTTDVELLIRAYRTWGEDCVEHLFGDFAFAVWDAPRRRLFCARDQLGIKPFFYTHLGKTVIFSNTLDCIRQHPGVSDKLNDLAIADFLLFGLNQDAATTSFADVQRIPPAHRAAVTAEGIRLDRYWTLPIDEPVYFKRTDDYTDRFKELLDVAVRDRLRTNKIAIFMSGGLDSPTLAATACNILQRRSPHGEVHGFTSLVNGFDQNERHYAGLVAERLGIPIHFRNRSVQMIDPKWGTTAVHTSEPIVDPSSLAGDREEYRSIAAYSRVLFYGEGPDNALHYEWKAYISYLARRGRFARAAADIGMHMVRHRRIPLVTTVPRMLRNWAKRDTRHIPFPNWFNESFQSRVRLRERWKEKEHRSEPILSHPIRPVGYRSFGTPLWELLFRCMDAEETGVPVETRHPFLDVRLLRYMLAVPAIPWCRVKYLERRTMRGMLPDSVLRRPKSPLTSNPVWEGIRRITLPPLHPSRALSEYVNCELVPKQAGDDMALFRTNFRPFALNYWLQNLRPEPSNHV